MQLIPKGRLGARVPTNREVPTEESACLLSGKTLQSLSAQLTEAHSELSVTTEF